MTYIEHYIDGFLMVFISTNITQILCMFCYIGINQQQRLPITKEQFFVTFVNDMISHKVLIPTDTHPPCYSRIFLYIFFL